MSVLSLRFDPLLPLWVLAVLAAAAVPVLGLAWWRRARGAGLRSVAAAVLLAWLAGPVLVRETRQGLGDVALLVTDRSGSMAVGSRAAQAEAARRAVREAAARLPGLALREVSVPEAREGGTKLWEAARQALADIPSDRLAGIVAITDGMVHDLPAAAPAGAPLQVLIPAKGEEWDRRVRIVAAPGYGIVGRNVDVRVAVEDLGPAPAPGGTVPLILRRDGEAPERRDVPVGAVQTIPVHIARAGPTVLEFSTPPPAGEASPINDRAVVQINGVRDRLRVLLVSGEPNQGERSWRRLLKSDPSVDLVHFTILRPPEKDDTTPLNELALIAFPTRELFAEKLSEFDLIILDRFTDRGILPHVYLRNIADYVRRGGALLLTTGPEFATPASLDQTPLAEVLPARAPLSEDGVVVAKFRPTVTALGERHPVTSGLPGANAGPGDAPLWGDWYRAIASEGVQGQVLMTGPESAPLLVLNHVGEGRAAMLLSDQIWLWARGHEGGGPSAELLRRVSHWLMKEPELEEERLTARLESGRLRVERCSAAEAAPPPILVTPPDGSAERLAVAPSGAGCVAGERGAERPGVWKASDGTRSAYAAAELANAAEYADLRATAERIGGLARASGGGVHFLQAEGVPEVRQVGATAEAGGEGWIGLRRRGAHLVTGVETEPLLPPWTALLVLGGVVIAAWRRESS